MRRATQLDDARKNHPYQSRLDFDRAEFQLWNIGELLMIGQSVQTSAQLRKTTPPEMFSTRTRPS